jgi:hypothetical protein
MTDAFGDTIVAKRFSVIRHCLLIPGTGSAAPGIGSAIGNSAKCIVFSAAVEINVNRFVPDTIDAYTAGAVTGFYFFLAAFVQHTYAL